MRKRLGVDKWLERFVNNSWEWGHTPNFREHVREHVRGHVCEHVERIVAVCAGEMTEKELREAVGMKNRSNFTVRYLSRALEGGYLERTDRGVRSRTQKYRLTETGFALAAEIAKRRKLKESRG